MDSESKREWERMLADVAASNRSILDQVGTIRRCVVFLAFVVGGILVLWVVSMLAMFLQSSPAEPHLYPFGDDSAPRQSSPR